MKDNSDNAGENNAKADDAFCKGAWRLEFPDDELIARIERGIAATFGSPLMELVRKLGLSVEDTIRFHLISKKCREERERAGLSIKDAARRLSVPQYRIRAVESVEIRNVAPMVLWNSLISWG